MIGKFRYIQNTLLRNEVAIYAVRPHWVIFSWSICVLMFAFYMLLYAPPIFSMVIVPNISLRLVAAVILFFMAAYSYLSALIYYKFAEYGVTNKRVIIKIGWIHRRSLEIMLEKVEGVTVDQTVFGRICGYGQITVTGTGGTNDSFQYIPNPLEFRRQVQQQIDAYENQFRTLPTK